jgi:hypothetical protein
MLLIEKSFISLQFKHSTLSWFFKYFICLWQFQHKASIYFIKIGLKNYTYYVLIFIFSAYTYCTIWHLDNYRINIFFFLKIIIEFLLIFLIISIWIKFIFKHWVWIFLFWFFFFKVTWSWFFLLLLVLILLYVVINSEFIHFIYWFIYILFYFIFLFFFLLFS